MTTGERIKKRREELGLTQTELAERMGYKSRAAICSVEKDKEDLTTTRIRKFAEVLNTTPAYLMGWEDTVVDYRKTVDGIGIIEPQGSKEHTLYDEIIQAYAQASPEVRKAVELLLKADQHES